MDEYDYIDIAVDTLRNIKFWTTEYVSYITVDPSSTLPCNIDTIDAVTTQKWAVLLELILKWMEF
jgi:hypothetical protein